MISIITELYPDPGIIILSMIQAGFLTFPILQAFPTQIVSGRRL